jgi:hypothetical protein
MKILVFLSLSFLMGCALPVSEERVIRIVEGQGYSQVETTGLAFFGCGEEDVLKSGFTAVDARGRQVKGVVCCGILLGKNCTVRVE